MENFIENSYIESTEFVKIKAGNQATSVQQKNIDKMSNKIILRVGEAGDKEPVREMLKRFHQTTIFGKYPFSDKKYEEHAQKTLAFPQNMVCIVAELNGAIVGLIWASAGQYSLSDELVLTTCHVIAVDQDNLKPIARAKTFLRLISAVKKWSNTRGASEVLVHVTTGTNLKTTDRLLRRSGAKCIGGGYVV